MTSFERKDDENYQRFMQALREFRKSADMTQSDVALALGKSQDWVSRCETGEHPVTFVETLAFANLYGVSVIDFANIVEDRRNRVVNDDYFFNRHSLQVIDMDWEFVRDGLNYAYSMLDVIDTQLESTNAGRLSTHVELANLSSIIGNFVGAGLAHASSGKYERNRPHAYPDLLRKSKTGFIDEQGIEIKFALETNKPKGHLPKEGYYMTFRYILGDEDGSYQIGYRGNTVWIWECRFGYLTASDFSLSSTAGDSGKTAVITTQAFYNMSLVYFDEKFCPHKRTPFDIPHHK